jgi:deoxyhypusine synthase
MIPAGMEEILCQLIERKIVTAIVSTGANLSHSMVNQLGVNTEGQAHYLGSPNDDDVDLFKSNVCRIYDTLIAADQFALADHVLYDLLRQEYPDSTNIIIKPSEFFALLGKIIKNRCLYTVATEHGVPLFCGATSDSELGLDLMKFREMHGFTIILDEIGDIGKFSKMIDKYPAHGTIVIGGGVPRNWAQQAFLYGLLRALTITLRWSAQRLSADSLPTRFSGTMVQPLISTTQFVPRYIPPPLYVDMLRVIRPPFTVTLESEPQ